MAQKARVIKVRLYPGADDDLLAYVADTRDPTRGARNVRIKELMRAGLEGGPVMEQSDIDMAELRVVVQNAIQEEIGTLLADIRRVVDTALSTHLARVAFQADGQDDVIGQDEETEALLDALGRGAMMALGDDEDD